MRIYIAGPYRGATPGIIDAHIAAARDTAMGLLRMGHIPFCPHTHTAYWDVYGPDVTDDQFIKLGVAWLEKCEAIVLLPGWEDSEGSQIELERAKELGLTVYDDFDEVEPV